MARAGTSLIDISDYVMARLGERLDGLTDDEFFWEPVPGCWSIRLRSDGKWRLDGEGGDPPPPEPVPLTTIAWRIGHLGALCLGGFAERTFGGDEASPDAIPLPESAAGVPTFLGENYGRWRAGLASWEVGEWEAPLGPKFGPYAEDNGYDLALHVLDEVIHHGAEVGLLRDLYLRRAELGRP